MVAALAEAPAWDLLAGPTLADEAADYLLALRRPYSTAAALTELRRLPRLPYLVEPAKKYVLDLLGTRTLPYTLGGAVGWLRDLAGCGSLMSLYNLYFPAEWVASTADVVPRDDALYSDAEWAFFRLVHERLFPLNYGFIEDGELNWVKGAEDRSDAVMVDTGYYGFDSWNVGFEDFDASWKLLLVLLAQVDGVDHDWTDTELAEELDPEVYIEATDVSIPWSMVGQQSWEITCRLHNAPELLLALPDAINMINHNTGTFFLDSLDGAETDFVWDVETIDYLTDDWARANAILSRVDAMRIWIEADEANASLFVYLYAEAGRATAEGGYPLYVALAVEAA